MKTTEVMVVRIYITESSSLLNTILSYLKDEANIRGVSVFRAISGFGDTGEHKASLLDLSLDLPLVVEFFDAPSKVKPALAHLNNTLKPKHVLCWRAEANDGLTTT